MFTIQQIINNQKEHKEKIIKFFLKETFDAKKELREIETKDEFIIKEKTKLLKKYKKTKTADAVKKYFFISNKRDENFYAWWDEEVGEPLILKYKNL